MCKVLLLAYKFPPYSGVGGYRWAKLVKYLVKLGHEIHVITVNWKTKKKERKSGDIVNRNIKIHAIPSGYLHNLKYKKYNNKFINALKYYFFYYIIDRYIYFDDEAQKWNIFLIRYCEKLIRNENIDVLIATGSPFQVNRWAAEIKLRNKKIFLIQDFRDAWFDEPYFSYTRRQESRVLKWQNFAVENADLVVSVSKGLLEVFLRKTKQKKGQVIYNGYDEEDINRYYISKKKKKEQGIIIITHIGNLSSGREITLKYFLNALRNINKNKMRIKFIHIGQESYVFRKHFKDLLINKTIRIMGYKKQKQAFEYIEKSDYALQLNAPELPYALSTKIFEYAALKTPCISINYGGELEELIRENNWGYSLNIEKDNLVEFLNKIQKKPKEKFKYNVDFFSYRNLAFQYSNIIQNSIKKKNEKFVFK